MIECKCKAIAFVPREEALAAFATAPVLDAEKLRRDLDAIAEQNLFDRKW